MYIYIYVCACSKAGHKICSQHFLGQKLQAVMKVVSGLNSFQIFCLWPLWRNNQQQWAHNTEICCAAMS